METQHHKVAQIINKFYVLFSANDRTEDRYHRDAKSDLCDVKISVRPLAQTRDNVFQRWRRATGSNPVDGSSRKTTGASPINATAVLNLRLLPPLHSTAIRPRFCILFTQLLTHVQTRTEDNLKEMGLANH